MSTKQKPTKKRPRSERHQRTVIKRQKAFGQSLREWLQDRANKAEKAREKQRKKDARKAKGKRGVDRVPARLRVKPRPTEWHYLHAPRWNDTGRHTKGTPFVDPARVERKLRPGTTNAARRRAARIRQELR